MLALVARGQLRASASEDESDDQQTIVLDRPILTIGRGSECDVTIQSSKISRQHCCVAQVTTGYVIRDLGSTNGVRINRKRVEESLLTAGDELIIGNVRFSVEEIRRPRPHSDYFSHAPAEGSQIIIPPKDSIVSGKCETEGESLPDASDPEQSEIP